jgi:hypothetical protein
VKIDDEDKTIILLCSMPPSYEQTVTTSMFGKESIKIEDITAALLTQEQRWKNNAVEDSQAIGLLVKGESDKKVEGKNKRKKVWCFHCKEWGHVIKESLANLKGSNANVVTHKSDLDSDGDVLSIAIKRQPTKHWLLDSTTSFHATHKRVVLFVQVC